MDAKEKEGDVTLLKSFKIFVAIDKDIKLHKYYESQKAKRDIGMDMALMDWIIKGHCKKCLQALQGTPNKD